MGENRQGKRAKEVFPLKNLYIHFPFCRRKCTYCALYSRAGQSEEKRVQYVTRLIKELEKEENSGIFKTIYFGGGTPCLCDLQPLFAVLKDRLAPGAEFSVELHPLDVDEELLKRLVDGGVNRISMGVQSLDDATLAAMGRGYTALDAARAFQLVKKYFENAGIDLIIGYPGLKDRAKSLETLSGWGLEHCSVYSLILEEKTILSKSVAEGKLVLPGDDEVLDEIGEISKLLGEMGLGRYEISNWAKKGRECRYNMSVWRGEDYIGLGTGAKGRVGLARTSDGVQVEILSAEEDMKERAIFALRTREGLDITNFPQWKEKLDAFVEVGLLEGAAPFYRLTNRGVEVCDSILVELV
ncbi:MAG: coproporphyrinogen III oxidase family protein [Kiritimatiellae bacterium]|nr:coproporphyrinogen III oxidase family protein [Kiritimatiellia bacterium]